MKKLNLRGEDYDQEKCEMKWRMAKGVNVRRWEQCKDDKLKTGNMSYAFSSYAQRLMGNEVDREGEVELIVEWMCVFRDKWAVEQNIYESLSSARRLKY